MKRPRAIFLVFCTMFFTQEAVAVDTMSYFVDSVVDQLQKIGTVLSSDDVRPYIGTLVFMIFIAINAHFGVTLPFHNEVVGFFRRDAQPPVPTADQNPVHRNSENRRPIVFKLRDPNLVIVDRGLIRGNMLRAHAPDFEKKSEPSKKLEAPMVVQSPIPVSSAPIIAPASSDMRKFISEHKATIAKAPAQVSYQSAELDTLKKYVDKIKPEYSMTRPEIVRWNALKDQNAQYIQFLLLLAEGGLTNPQNDFVGIAENFNKDYINDLNACIWFVDLIRSILKNVVKLQSNDKYSKYFSFMAKKLYGAPKILEVICFEHASELLEHTQQLALEIEKSSEKGLSPTTYKEVLKNVCDIEIALINKAIALSSPSS